ncbi:acyl carrier protein [Actinoplanes sp. NPDC020271]|uniref:acyl carrier protein n=1 Tax=Actinoplanes sp. NPDC020271 TaxID=3363896 RepID=UPI0037BA3D86
MSETSRVPGRQAVTDAVKRLVVRESRLSIGYDRIADDEPLNGSLLRITSMGLLGMLIKLEDELDVTLPDDIFVGKVMYKVSDLVDVISEATTQGEVAR